MANTLAFNRQLLSVPCMALGDGEDILTNQVEDWELSKAPKQESSVNLFEVWEDGGQHFGEWIRRRTEGKTH